MSSASLLSPASVEKPVVQDAIEKADLLIEAMGWMRAASQTCGDCFDLWKTHDGRLGILLVAWETMRRKRDDFGYYVMTDVALAYSRLGNASRSNEAIALVEECRRVLKPDGESVFQVYNRISWLNALSKLMKVGLEHDAIPDVASVPEYANASGWVYQPFAIFWFPARSSESYSEPTQHVIAT